jgi:hypothetical protein
MAALDGHVSEGERDEIRRLLEDTDVPPGGQGGHGHA